MVTACKKDKDNSTLGTNTLNEFYIDTVGAVKNFQVQQSVGELIINPEVVYQGDASTLNYLWRMYDVNTTFIDTLSKSKQLNIKTSRPASATNYTVELQITDPATAIRSFMTYSVQVIASRPYGWEAVYETSAGGRSDVALIRTAEIVKGLTADVVMKDIYASANGESLPGTPVSIASNFNAEMIATSSTVVRVNPPDYKKTLDFNALFRVQPPVPKPEGFIGSSLSPLVNDGQIYWQNGAFYLGKIIVDDLGYKTAPMSFNPNILSHSFFDALNNRFISITRDNDQATAYAAASTAANFSLNNIQRNILSLDAGSGGFAYAFFEEKDKSKRWLYGINFADVSRPDKLYRDVSNLPGIFNAKYFQFGTLASVGFYATDQGIFNFTYSTSSNSVFAGSQLFTAPTGEVITAMNLFLATGSGYTGTESKSNKLMFVSTWNAGAKNGKIYLLSVDPVTGVIGSTPLKTFDGFGKIAKMTLKVQ